MKAKHLLIAALIIINCQLIIDDCFGQNIGINATGNPANSSAGLDVDFTNKGFLLPRMTTAQRNAIVSPASGLMIYNTTTKCFEFYENAIWNSMVCACTTPPAPTANAASSIASTSFTANWTASAGATAYYLDVNTNSAFTGTWILNNVNVGNVTSYSVTGLTCATTYYYRVRANNSCGTSANSNTITVTTSSCCPIGSLSYSTGGWDAGGCYFNIQAINCVTIKEIRPYCDVGETATWNIYYRAGTYSGFETNSAAWTLLGSASISCTGSFIPTFTFSVNIPAGLTYGFYIVETAASSSSNTITTESAITEGTVYASNADMNLISGKRQECTGCITPFGSGQLANGALRAQIIY